MVPEEHSMIESNTKVRDLPAWLTALILLLSVAGGGYLLYWYINQDKPGNKQIVKADPALQNRGNNWRGTAGAPNRNIPNRTGNNAIPTDGIRPDPKRPNAWDVRSGEALLYASIDKTGALDITPSYSTQNLTPEQAQLLLMRRRLLADQPMRDHVKLTSDQYEKLRAIPNFKGMMVTDEQRGQLVQLFTAWQKATDKDKPAAQKELLVALAEIGKKQLEPTKTFDASRAQAVKDIVSAEQLKLLQATPPSGAVNTPRPNPTTKTTATPATKPTSKPTAGTANTR